MKAVLLIPVFFLFSCSNDQVKNFTDGEVVKLAGEFIFTEGPAANPAGEVYFTDIPNNKILIWTIDSQLKVLTDQSNGANGLFFDDSGNMIVCEGAAGRITRMNPKEEFSILTDHYMGKRYNRPNNLWVDPSGGVYFSDPAYSIPDSLKSMEIEGVYYLSPVDQSVMRVCDDFIRPNGIVGTPDGKTLYITDAGGGKTWKYSIQPDGSLSGKELFVEMGCDGMTIDKRGNVYLTNGKASSIDIYSPKAELLQSILFPENPSNCCFGGAKNRILFVTARTSLYSIQMRVKGV